MCRAKTYGHRRFCLQAWAHTARHHTGKISWGDIGPSCPFKPPAQIASGRAGQQPPHRMADVPSCLLGGHLNDGAQWGKKCTGQGGLGSLNPCCG